MVVQRWIIGSGQSRFVWIIRVDVETFKPGSGLMWFCCVPPAWFWWPSGSLVLQSRWWWVTLWRTWWFCRSQMRRPCTGFGPSSSPSLAQSWTPKIWRGRERRSASGWRGTGYLWRRRGTSWEWPVSWQSCPHTDLKTAAAPTRSSWTVYRDWSGSTWTILDRVQRLIQIQLDRPRTSDN